MGVTDPTARLRCHQMLRHAGVVWLSLELAGRRVRRGEQSDDLDVCVDRYDVWAVLHRWDGEGSVEVLES